MYGWSCWVLLLFIILMQPLTKPRYYADVNKQMGEEYYNYETYEIEYGYSSLHSATSTVTRSLPKSAKVSTRKYIRVSLLIWISKSLSRHLNPLRRAKSSVKSKSSKHWRDIQVLSKSTMWSVIPPPKLSLWYLFFKIDFWSPRQCRLPISHSKYEWLWCSLLSIWTA